MSHARKHAAVQRQQQPNAEDSPAMSPPRKRLYLQQEATRKLSAFADDAISTTKENLILMKVADRISCVECKDEFASPDLKKFGAKVSVIGGMDHVSESGRGRMVKDVSESYLSKKRAVSSQPTLLFGDKEPIPQVSQEMLHVPPVAFEKGTAVGLVAEVASKAKQATRVMPSLSQDAVAKANAFSKPSNGGGTTITACTGGGNDGPYELGMVCSNETTSDAEYWAGPSFYNRKTRPEKG